MNKKRILCGILAFATALSFAGCGKKGGEMESGDAKTLKWYVPCNKQPDIVEVNEALNKLTMEKSGFKVDMQFIDSTAYSERMNMNMASGDDFDIAWVGYLSQMSDAASKGGIIAIDELLKETPALVESIPDYAWEQAVLNGKTYGVPNMQIMASQRILIINKELAEKYNLDVSKITKTTDIEPFLETIKQNEPDKIPFDLSYGVASFGSVDDYTNYTGEPLYALYKDENGKWIAGDGMEVADTYGRAKILNDWYKKGYIRKDIASVIDNSLDMKAGKYAVTVANYKPGYEAEFESKNGYAVVTAKITPVIAGNLQARQTMQAIGRKSGNPNEAIKFIELLNTDKSLYNLVCFGIEGKHYTKKDGEYIELAENSGYAPNAAWKFGNQFNAYLLPGQSENVWEETEKMNDEAFIPETNGFDFDTSKIKGIVTNLTAVTDEYKVIRQGIEDPDVYWEEYKQRLYDAGLQQYLDECQKQLDEFMANKNK